VPLHGFFLRHLSRVSQRAGTAISVLLLEVHLRRSRHITKFIEFYL